MTEQKYPVMRKILPVLIGILFVGGCSIMGTKTPEPRWHSVKQDGAVELRDYDPMIVAEVTTTGERYEAINAGFRILAGYIFGGNKAQTKIAMTAPVTQEATEDQKTWKVRFIMPPASTPAMLPVPNDNRIRLLEIPAYRVAVIQFAGFNTDSNLNEHQKILMDWLARNNITSIGSPTYAFYNPPWTLPFFKRNEIMVKIPQ